MFTHLFGDLRYAARRLFTSPGFTTAAVLTIAIGVGINTAIFSVLNGFALRELPAPDADELVTLHQTLEGVRRRVSGSASRFSVAEYEAYRDGSETLSGLMAYSGSTTVTLAGETPREISGALVSCNYFEVLRQPPALGAGFPSEACVAGTSAPAVVLGHDLWASAFGADPAIVGRDIVLNRQSFTVVGVAGEGMRGVDFQAASFFATFASQPLLSGDDLFGNSQASWLALVGRRASRASLDQVRAELRVIAGRIDQEQPTRSTRLVVERAQTLSMPEARKEVFSVAAVVMAAFGMVLLIACANVANLLLARATRRSAEISVRLSLGASRARIVQQLLAEAVLLAAAGGALGCALALWSSQSVVTFALSELRGDPPLIVETAPDARVFAFAFLLTLATALIFGLLPALRASKRELHTAMKGGTPMGQRAEGRLQGALIGAQVALSTVLMIAAALLLRGLYEAQTVEPGFRYQGVAVASFDLTRGGYDDERAAAFQRQLVERVGALPGVDGVARAQFAPLTGNFETMARLPGEQELFALGFNNVSADYFSLLEIPIVRGRAFTADDETDESTAVIVTEAAARRLWPGRDPIGQKFVVGVGPNQVAEVGVVGVARDAQVAEVGNVPSSYVYLPIAPRTQRGAPSLLISSRFDVVATAAAVRSVVAELDRGLVVRVVPLQANLDEARSLAKLVSVLATALGTVALALAAVGIYGVIAYAVGRRVREIGLRMALGAGRGDVVALVLKQQLRPVAIGGAIGLAAAVAVSRILSSVLFGVSPTDGVALLAAVLVVVGVAVTAGFLPARRASRVDPNTVLHYE
jgi:predicted permease